MPLTRDHAIRPRDESDDEDASDVTPTMSVDSGPDDDKDEDLEDEHSQHSMESVEQSEEGDLQDVSFGALAAAQARLGPNPRKRKLAGRNEPSEGQPERHQERRKDFDQARQQKEHHATRSSKHAPTVMSTRNPVSRKRSIFSPPPAAKFRDPRFDATIIADGRRGNTSSTQRASQNYAFLTDYQAAEVLDLKSQLKKAKDPDQQAQLKRQIMSIEAKLRNTEFKRREVDILQEHKRKEREAIKQGKKARPYYLKQSDVKQRIEQERREAMGKRARDKSEKRKKKREKAKEARDMPRARRLVDQNA